jgi:hypothetical protein
MKYFAALFLALAIVASADRLFAHGFNLTANSNSNPTGFSSIISESNFLDQNQDYTADPTGYSQLTATYGSTPSPYVSSSASTPYLFNDEFQPTSGSAGLPGSEGSIATSSLARYNANIAAGGYGTYEGFSVVSNSNVPWTNATFTILSPLMFAGSDSSVAPASAGTSMQIYNLYAGNSDGNHPGAGSGVVTINGTSTMTPSHITVSLQDFHELEKDLLLGQGSTQTYGEYGFAFDVAIPFANGTTVTTPALVDMFALSDPAIGDYSDNADDSVQDPATLNLYNALESSAAANLAAAPEPPTALLVVVAAALVACRQVRKRRTRVLEVDRICLPMRPQGLSLGAECVNRKAAA